MCIPTGLQDYKYVMLMSRASRIMSTDTSSACFERRDMLAFMREAGLGTRFQEQGLMPGRGLCRGQGLSLRHRLERRRVGKGAVHAPGFASCKAQHRAHAERAFPRHTKRVGTVLLCATYKAVDVDRTFAHPYELRRMALAEDNVPA